MKKILFSNNTCWNMYNFRLPVMQAMRDAGYEVAFAAPYDSYTTKLQALGFSYYPVAISKRGTNPIADIKLLYDYVMLYRKVKPDVVLHYTIKPNIYGTLAASWVGVSAISTITGLGYLFVVRSAASWVGRLLYRIALPKATQVFFQNGDDRDLFVREGLVPSIRCRLVPGSGIDTQRFAPVPKTAASDTFVFLLIGRLLRDKGIEEYVEAARHLLAKHKGVRFCLLGPIGSQEKSAITTSQLQAWQNEECITYLGKTDEVSGYIAEADCVVLPSYREGTPRTLLEAASMAKPLIATDVPGCREVVEEGVNGFLCQAKDAADLARAMEQMLALSPEDREAMGERGREKMLKQFDEKIVIARYLEVLQGLFGDQAAR